MFHTPKFARTPGGASGPSVDHSAYGVGEIHKPFNWVVADTAARDALAPVAADVHKALWQIDTSTIYILTNHSPVTWASVGGGSAVAGPAFGAYANAGTAIPAGATTRVLLQVEDYDTDGQFATDVFTCVTPGIYNFSGRVSHSASLTGNQVATIRKNGVEFVSGLQTAGATFSWSVGGDIKLIAGDVVDLAFYSSTAFTTVASNRTHCYLQGHFVRS